MQRANLAEQLSLVALPSLELDGEARPTDFFVRLALASRPKHELAAQPRKQTRIKLPPQQAAIGARIRSERKRLGLRQGEVAERIGVSREAVVRWELGYSTPNAKRLVALSAHGFDAIYCMTGHGPAATAVEVDRIERAKAVAIAAIGSVLADGQVPIGVLHPHPADIKSRIEKAGFTMSEVARELGVSHQAVNTVVHGAGKSTRVAERIAARLGTTAAALWPAIYGAKA